MYTVNVKKLLLLSQEQQEKAGRLYNFFKSGVEYRGNKIVPDLPCQEDLGGLFSTRYKIASGSLLNKR